MSRGPLESEVGSLSSRILDRHRQLADLVLSPRD